MNIIDTAEKHGLMVPLVHFLQAFKLTVLNRKADICAVLLVILLPSFLIAATLQSLIIYPNGRNFPVGTQQQCRALGSYDDGSFREITAGLTWWATGSAGAVNDTGGLSITEPGSLRVYVSTAGVHTSMELNALVPKEAFPEAVRPVTLKVTWEPNPEPDLAGYNLYFGYSSNEYLYLLSTANTTEHLSGVAKGLRFFVGVSAYDHSGNESGVARVKVGIPDIEQARKGGSFGGGVMR